MKILIPNAKELNTNLDSQPFQPLSAQSQSVLSVLAQMSEEELVYFFKIKLDKAQLEADRFQRILTGQAKTYPAWQLYDGLMYRYMKRVDLTEEEVEYLQQHALIATGLYGLIPVFDLISPHRLDFQGNLMIEGISLKQYWREQYNNLVADDDVVVSFLSSEFEAVFSPAIQKKLMKIIFMENRKGNLKIHSTISKKGRGRFLSLMAAKNVQTVDQLKTLSTDGFVYRADLSEEKNLVFVREV